MVPEFEREHLQTVLTDTVTVLCRNSLVNHSVKQINALVGVTLDTGEVILVTINDIIADTCNEDPFETNTDVGNADTNDWPDKSPAVVASMRTSNVKQETVTDVKKFHAYATSPGDTGQIKLESTEATEVIDLESEVEENDAYDVYSSTVDETNETDSLCWNANDNTGSTCNNTVKEFKSSLKTSGMFSHGFRKNLNRTAIQRRTGMFSSTKRLLNTLPPRKFNSRHTIAAPRMPMVTADNLQVSVLFHFSFDSSFLTHNELNAICLE